MTSWW